MRDMTGIRRRGDKWYPFVYIPHYHAKPIPTMQQWRRDQYDRFHGTAPVDGSIADDVRRYVATDTFKAKATADAMTVHLDLWIAALGRDRTRQSVTTADIAAVAADWSTAAVVNARGRSCPRGLAAGTIIKRLTSLQSFYEGVRADGESNPVADVVRPPTPKPIRRDHRYTKIDDLIAA